MTIATDRAAALRASHRRLDAARQVVYARCHGRCERCGGPLWVRSVHHRRPRGMGGSRVDVVNSPVNLVALCGTATSPAGCHLAVESDRDAAYEAGWLVRQGADPGRVPVRLWDGRRVLLTEDGGYEEAAA